MALANSMKKIVELNMRKIRIVFGPTHHVRTISRNTNVNFSASSVLQTKTNQFAHIINEFNNNVPNLIQETKQTVDVDVVADRLEEILNYNIPGGKRIRSTIMLESYAILEKPENMVPDNIKLVRLLAWCIELFGTAGGMADDMIDQSTYRRGSLCWYKKPTVGLKALNDSILMLTSLYILLLNNFRNKSYYLQLVDLFDRMFVNSFTGQCIDDKTNKSGKPDLTTFTMDYFKRMVYYKTTEYTLFTPIEVILLVTGRRTDSLMSVVRPILEEIGIFFQVQNDYQDCYDNKSNTGKDGNDISQGKCSWLAIKALELANAEDKKVIQECYGEKDEQKVKKVVDIYNKLNLSQEFRKYEEASLNSINKQLTKVPSDIPKEFFDNILQKFHKRI